MFIFAGKFWVIMLCVLAGHASQRTMGAQQNQLPAESEIPGERPWRVENLPSEASLLEGARVKNELPLESVLVPGSDDQQQDSDINKNGNAALNLADMDGIQEFSQRPILRIRGDGPVAELKSVCFSSDSKRIFAGGFDKTVHVWQRLNRGNADETWAYEKPFDWQINRGNQGQIFSVAVGKKNIVFGGVGASASNGEIILLDSDQIEFSQALADVEAGHVDSIFALATDLENRVVASIDIVGRAIAWRRDLETGKWNLETLRATDTEILGPVAGKELLDWRSRGGAIAVADSQAIVYPEVSRPFAPGTPPSWHLVRVSADGTSTKLAANEPHRGTVVAIACSPDGNRIVSADLRDKGRLFLWDLKNGPNAVVKKIEFPVRCLDLSSDGTQLIIGTARNAEGNSQTLVLNWRNDGSLTQIAKWDGTDDVQACALSPDGTRLVFSRGAKVVVGEVKTGRVLQVLKSKMQQPTRVAFSSLAGDYRCRIRTDTDPRLRWSFNPAELNLKQLANEGPEDWVVPNPRSEIWKLKVSTVRRDGLPTYFVEVAGKRFCQLPRESQMVGDITTFAFVASAKNPDIPVALVVGTSGKNHIYVFRIGREQCEIVREYRGHTAAIASVGVSADKKYLISAAGDGTVCFWKLSAAFEDKNWNNPNRQWLDRWGAEFVVAEKKLVVSDLIEDGPLYFRGVRKNDVIESVAWPNPGGKDETLTDPATIAQRLATASADRLIRFRYRRGPVEQPYFYLYPAWQPLAQLAIDGQREWAFWTPYGFYDASFNGHKFFGWQINQGVNRPVNFFRAAELKNDLERPEMMQNLLSTGSVESAFEMARSIVPHDLSDRLSAISRLQPTVEILRVEPGLRPDRVILTAKIELVSGVEIGRVKAFANGVPAKQQTILSQSADPLPVDGSKQVFQYRFDFDLPHDKKIKLQVLAASELGQAAMAETIIDGPENTPSLKPRIFVMALGVGKYRDGQIPPLDFAQLNAGAVVKQLVGTSQTSDRSVLLTDHAGNRSMWLVTTRWMADEMRRTARPDDLLVVFLSGHGFRDPVDETYFFLTADTKYADVMARRYGDCISFDELSAFGGIGCRKLVILDTCHSGALQALRQQNLKSLVRTLENDLFFTLTASEGSEVAFESKERGLGLFTARLIEAVKGQADEVPSGGNGDGVVTLAETVQFLKATVPIDAARLGNYQFPTASPADLLELAEINLTAPTQ